MEQTQEFIGNAQPAIGTFNSPLAGKPARSPAEVLEAWRADNAIRATERVGRYADGFVTAADGHLLNNFSEQEVLDHFADFAAELQTSVMQLEVYGLLTEEVAERLADVRAELVNAASLALMRVSNSTSELAIAAIRSERIQQFIELSRPRINAFREFFYEAGKTLHQARAEAGKEQQRMEAH